MTRGKKKEIDMVEFRRDVEMGATPLVLAEKYGISKATVWKHKAEISGKIARHELGPMPSEEEAEAEQFTLAIEVPSDRIDDLLASVGDGELRTAVMELSSQDKATILQVALQNRLNESLAPSTVELPRLVAEAV